MDSITNRSFNVFSDILGRRVGNSVDGGSLRLTQLQVQKHVGPFDSSIYTRSRKNIAVIKQRR
jgi:hypothetical protein